ncbi:MAG: phospho-N-acetylmuramoyl-pentapeptide-transferase [Pseudomonadota bacterium]
MLYHLLVPLADSFSFLNVFRYATFRIVMAALTALVATLVLYPGFIRALQRLQWGQSIREDGPESHLQKKGTPTMGGALLLGTVFLSVGLWADLTNTSLWMVSLVTAGYGALGFVDDYRKIRQRNSKGVSAKGKLLWQFLIAGVAVGLLLYVFKFDNTRVAVPFLSTDRYYPTLPLIVYLGFAVFVVVVTSNAVNLTDGLDGLAIGPTIVSAFVFMLLAYAAGTKLGIEVKPGEFQYFDIARYLRIPYQEGAPELAVFCAAIIGSSIGFLWYNTYPASVFMGDVGSLALGGALGMLAIVTKNEFLSAIIHGVFAMEALSVVIQVTSFKLTGKRVFKMSPIHHHFELAGWAEPKIIVRFWIVSIMLALFALATLKLR